MLKETIKYEDFDGNEVTETHYFNLSKSQLIELDARHQPEGWGRHLQNTVNKNDPNELMDLFLSLLRMTYGVRDEATNKFRQSDEIFEDFQSSLAYDQFFSDLFMKEGKLEEFIRGVMPKDVREALDGQTIQTSKLENTRREISVESRDSVAEKLANDIRGGRIKTDESPEQKRARLQKELDDLK